ncbi:polypeptide [Homalodisca vitripennis]|nr:polypeptide [Homalodisca vitripennis]
MSQIRNGVANELCVDTKHKGADDPFGLEDCVSDSPGRKGEQEFQLTWHKDIRTKGRGMCWDVSSPNDKAPVQLYTCHGGQGNQLWKYDVSESLEVACCVRPIKVQEFRVTKRVNTAVTPWTPINASFSFHIRVFRTNDAHSLIFPI